VGQRAMDRARRGTAMYVVQTDVSDGSELLIFVLPGRWIAPRIVRNRLSASRVLIATRAGLDPGVLCG
jgi:hypothetical protein